MCVVEGVIFSGIRVGWTFQPCVMSFICFLVYSDALLCFVLLCSKAYSIVLVHFSKVFASCLTQEVMTGRNDRERLLTEALNNLAQVMANQGGDGGAVAYQGLDCF